MSAYVCPKCFVETTDYMCPKCGPTGIPKPDAPRAAGAWIPLGPVVSSPDDPRYQEVVARLNDVVSSSLKLREDMLRLREEVLRVQEEVGRLQGSMDELLILIQTAADGADGNGPVN